MIRRKKSRRRSSRRSSRRRSSRRRSSRRRVSRNQRYVVANRRRRRSSKLRRRRRIRKNGMLGSVDWQHDVIMPILFGTGGFVAARYAGNMAAEKDWGTTDPKIAKTGAAILGIPLVFLASPKYPSLARHSGALVLGLGLAASEAWLRDTKLLGGSPAAAALAPDDAATTSSEGSAGVGSYYDLPVQGGQAASLSAYYETGDLSGADMVSTVTPTDMALPAHTMPQAARIAEPFAAGRGDNGYAGGMFARQLFSGMMGS